MIKERYKITYKDFLMLKKTGKQKNTKLAKYDFTNTIVIKPWGMEYLFMENKECCGWMLHINKHYGTSLHCHRTKQTAVYVISGILLLTTIRKRQLLQPGDMVLIDKEVFHAMGAMKDDTRVIELEMLSSKTDSIRAVDYWKRTGEPYESKCLLMTLQNKKLDFKKFELAMKEVYEIFTQSNKSSVKKERDKGKEVKT